MATQLAVQYWDDTPTFTEEEQAFLKAYQAECERMLAVYQQQSDPKNPRRTFHDLPTEETIINNLPETYRHYLEGWHRREDRYRTVFIYGVSPINEAYNKACQAHFDTLVAQASLPLAPPYDYKKPVKVKYWQYSNGGYDNYKPVEVHGQIYFSHSLWRGERTYDFMVLPLNAQLFKLRITGSREAKRCFHEQMQRLAVELSKLTDWSQVKGLSVIQQVVLKQRIDALKAEVTQ